MRGISSTLLAAQQQASRIPFVKVEASNRHAEVVNPLYDDDSDYGYGQSHPVIEGSYR